MIDMQMPEMDGLEATKKIRASSGPNKDVPIIAMTAYAMRGDRERFLEAGMNDYVSKPVMPRALSETLSKWLPTFVRTDEVEAEPAGETTLADKIPVWDKGGFFNRLPEDEGLIRMILDTFLKDAPAQLQLQDLREAIEKGDVQGVEFQAHRIKGAASNVGGEAVRQAAFEIEKTARLGDLSYAREHLATLKKLFGQLIDILERELSWAEDL